MTLINLTNIFTTPLSSAAQSPKISFRSAGMETFRYNELERPQDNFVSNPLSSDLDASGIERLAKSNPKIMQLLKGNVVVNYDELTALKKGHLNDTRVIAAKIYSNLNDELKKEINMKDIQQAAMLHDYGKVLIPKKILYKECSLTPEEKGIMELHSELGYELLKQQGVNERVLNLIKYHHQKPDGSGYPAKNENDNFEYGLSLQNLIAADKYSALTEERCYRKDAFNKKNALDIIYEDVKTGLISQEVYDALRKSVI